MKGFLLGWSSGFLIVALLNVFWGMAFPLYPALITTFIGAIIGTIAAHFF